VALLDQRHEENLREGMKKVKKERKNHHMASLQK